MINFIRGTFFSDKNLLGSLLSNLRHSIAAFSTYGLDRHFSTTLDIVSKIESGQPVDPFYSYPMIPKNYSIPDAKIKRILSVREEPRRDPYSFTESSVYKPRIQPQKKARWADPDDEWVPSDENLDSSFSGLDIERRSCVPESDESSTEDDANLNPLVQEPLKNITNFSAAGGNSLSKSHREKSASKLEEFDNKKLRLDGSNRAIDSDSWQENIASKQKEMSTTQPLYLWSDESDYSLSPRERFQESPPRIHEKCVLENDPKLTNSSQGWEENKQKIKNKRNKITSIMDHISPRSRQDYHGGEKCSIKKAESLSKSMDEKVEEKKKKIKKRKFKSHFAEYQFDLPPRSRDEYLERNYGDKLKASSAYDSYSSDDSLPFKERKGNRIQSMDDFSPTVKEEKMFKKIGGKMKGICTDDQRPYPKCKREIDDDNNFAEQKERIPFVLKKLSGKKHKESIAINKLQSKKQMSQKFMVDSDSSLPDPDEYLAPNTKHKSFHSPCRKTVSGNEKKFTRRDDSPRHYKENVLNEKYWLTDEEEYNSRRHGSRTFYATTSDESNLSEDDYRSWKSSIRYPLLSNWDEDEENAYEYDDFRKSEKKRRHTEHTPSRKPKQKLKKDQRYIEARERSPAKDVLYNSTQKEIIEQRKKKKNVNRRCISLEDFIKNSPSKHSKIDIEGSASQKDKTRRNAEYKENRHNPGKCNKHCNHELSATQYSKEPSTDGSPSIRPIQNDPYKTPEITKLPKKSSREILPISPRDRKKTEQDIRNYLNMY